MQSAITQKATTVRCVGMFLCLLLVGCSGGRDEPVYPTRGQVLLDGQPLSEALVAVHRLDVQQRSLTARTDSTGWFELTTHEPGDGAPVGEYAATVEYRELVQEGDEPTRSGRNLLPARYADPAASGLRCNVRAGENIWPAWQLSSQ